VRLANRLVGRFVTSRHAERLDAFVATMAAHCLLAHHYEQGGVDRPWASFDVGAFTAWLADNAFFHPSAGVHLVESWVALTGFLADEDLVDAFTAQRVQRDFARAEARIVDLVIDRYLRFAVAVGVDRAS
jgi:hypothetical protein